MKKSVNIGFSFGLTSGIITTLGLLIGLNYSTHSKLVVLGGIMTIAVADALSDALGIHISQESQIRKSKEVWESTFATLISKFVFAMSFAVPILLFNLSAAVIISIIYGLSLLAILSYYIAKKEKKKPFNVIMEHIVIAALVIIFTYMLGNMIGTLFV